MLWLTLRRTFSGEALTQLDAQVLHSLSPDRVLDDVDFLVRQCPVHVTVGHAVAPTLSVSGERDRSLGFGVSELINHRHILYCL